MRNRVGLDPVSAVSLALLTPPAFADIQDRVDSKVGGTHGQEGHLDRVHRGEFVLPYEGRRLRRIGRPCGLHTRVRQEGSGPSNWLGILTDEEEAS